MLFIGDCNHGQIKKNLLAFCSRNPVLLPILENVDSLKKELARERRQVSLDW